MNENLAVAGDNHFYDPDTASAPDTTAPYNAIQFLEDVNTNVAFSVTEVPYYINKDYWNINDTGSLSIAPGSVIKVASGARIRAFGPISSPGDGRPSYYFHLLHRFEYLG